MKKLILSIVAVATISLSSFGQAPEGFKYQAVVRDAGNIILNSQAVGMRMTILQGSLPGTLVYQETFTPTTNAYGLVNLEIGNGTVVSGTFATINWANGPFFIETAVDVSGGTSYTVMGTSQLMSVPFALHANTANNVVNDAVDDADNDPSNEIQDISLTGTNLTISGGSTVNLSSLQSSPTYTIGLWPELGGYVFWVSTDGKHGLVAETQDGGMSDWYSIQNLLSNPATHSVIGANFRDWRLPTKYELNEMYLQYSLIGGFSSINSYLSSTEFSSTEIYYLSFMGATWYTTVKNTAGGAYYRAVRSF